MDGRSVPAAARADVVVSRSLPYRAWPRLHRALWSVLPKHPFTMRAVFERVWLINLRMPRASLAAHLPEGIVPDMHDGLAWLSVVCADMRDMRPVFLPRPFGVRLRQVVYRACVRHGDEPGVFFLHTVADHALYAWGGDLLTFFHFHRGAVQYETEPMRSRLRTITTCDADLDVEIEQSRANWHRSRFDSEEAARPFLVERYAAFSQWRGLIGRIEVQRPSWQERAVGVVGTPRIAFADRALEGWECDSALYGEDVHYRWSRWRQMSR